MNQLAILGGQPVRPTRKSARPAFEQRTLDQVMGLIARGELAEFYGGRYVRRFESAYAAHFGRRRAVAVNSGTSALHLAFVCADRPPLSEVVVPANAYVSAFTALLQADLVPVLCDLDPDTWAMSGRSLEDALSPETSMVVPVHMYGQPCEMDVISRLCGERDLVLIEDCGQSHGAVADGRVTGTFGQAAVFSLCCRKHVALGEGGIVITDDEAFADRAKSLAHKGKGTGWFDYLEMGYSYNMTEVQAVLGLDQLARLDEQIRTRTELAGLLREGLSDLGLVFPRTPDGSTHAYFKQNALLPAHLGAKRNEIVDAIRAENVGCDPSHPNLADIGWIRNRDAPLFRRLGGSRQPDYDPDRLPVATDVLSRQICIEVGPGLDTGDIHATIEAIRKVVRHFDADA
jgi:perosamine synthetase